MRLRMRRRGRRSSGAVIAGVALVIAVGLIASLCSTSEAPADAPLVQRETVTIRACAAPLSSQDALCVDPATLQSARVLRIVDGDTFRAEIDGREEIIRFYGIDTPERGDACFSDATEAARALLGDEVRLRPDARERDRYGRLLRYVYTETGASIDAALIAGGLARAWRDDGALRDTLIGIEERARAEKIGCLWGGSR